MLLKVTQNYFPEILAKVFIINAGLVFRAAWKLIKPFVDKHVLEKIEILGSDFIKKLEVHIDRRFIPRNIGGDCEDLIQRNPGPWQEEYYKSIEEN